jgi:uncharacterized protein (DUF697 family)
LTLILLKEVLGMTSETCVEAGVIIADAVKWSAAAGAIPIPYVDLAALGAVQYTMVRDLTSLYGNEADKGVVKTVVSTTLGTLAPTYLSGHLVGSSLKVIPGPGTILGSASVAAFSAAATYSIGKIFVRHFESGGTLKSFSAESIQEELKDEFASASEKAGSKKDQPNSK